MIRNKKKNDRFRNHDFIVKDLFKDDKKLFFTEDQYHTVKTALLKK